MDEPMLCDRCHHILTRTPEQLATYVELIADRMQQLTSSWPRAELVKRLTRELQLDDEVVALGIGRFTIRRGDDTLSVIYRSES